MRRVVRESDRGVEGPLFILSLCREIRCRMFFLLLLSKLTSLFSVVAAAFPAVNLECKDTRAGPSCERVALSQENQGS